jgi:hypothetical protein
VNLDGVSCSSATACTAVGLDQSGIVAERWNGRRWLLQPTPRVPEGSLVGVSCPSAKLCFAVGGNAVSDPNSPTGENFSLIIKWNGLAWSLEPYRDDGLLSGVSCATRQMCQAVGGYGTSGGPVGTIERWNGHVWADQPIDSGDLLQGVSCSSPRACLGVGSNGISQGDTADRWGGRTWASVPTASPDILTRWLACLRCQHGAPAHWSGVLWATRLSVRVSGEPMVNMPPPWSVTPGEPLTVFAKMPL